MKVLGKENKERLKQKEKAYGKEEQEIKLTKYKKKN
jgi:hypothetical protein